MGGSPTQAWDTANADYMAGQYDLAVLGFEAYIKNFPKSERADDAQVAICADIQRQAFLDVPCIPLGEYRALTAHKADLSGFAPGTTLFFGVKRG